MEKVEAQSSVAEKFKSIIRLTGIAVFGVIGYEIAAEAGAGFAERVGSTLLGGFVGKAVSDGIVK